jgi:uncharacterized membrane protein
VQKEATVRWVVHHRALRLQPLQAELHIMIYKTAVREARRLQLLAPFRACRLARGVGHVAKEPDFIRNGLLG